MIEQKPVPFVKDMKVIQNDQHSVLARNMNNKIVIMSVVSDLNKMKKQDWYSEKMEEGLMDKDRVALPFLNHFL